MKTPITLEDPRLTAYALGDLVNPEDVATIEAALKESPELQAYVDDIVGLGETLTLEFAEETLPEEASTVVTPKRSVWRYVAPLGVAAAIAVVATQFVDISAPERGSYELTAAAESVPEMAAQEMAAQEMAAQEMNALRGAQERARSRMNEVAQRHRILDTELAVNERPELPDGSAISVPVSLAKNPSKDLGVSRKEMNRQLAEYGEAKNEYEQLSALLATASGRPEAERGGVVAGESELGETVANMEMASALHESSDGAIKSGSPGQSYGLDKVLMEEQVAVAGDSVTGTGLGHQGPLIDPATMEPVEERQQVAALTEAKEEVRQRTERLMALSGGAELAYREAETPRGLVDSLNTDFDDGFGNGLGEEADAELHIVSVGSGMGGSVGRADFRRGAARPSKATPDGLRWHEILGSKKRVEDLVASANRESYAPTTDNAFKEIVNPGDERATFSTDVDTASYSNVRRFVGNGQLPPKDAVRVEELINYFHYDYPQPEGDHPFSVSLEVNEAPWKTGHRLLRIGLKAKDVMVDKRPDSNLVFLVDVSGSMNSYDKLPLLKKSLKAMVGGLTERDLVSFVTYAGQSKVHLPPTPGHETGRLIAAIDQLQSGGSTNGASGIQMAYEQASKHRLANGVNRVLLATDGDFNVGVTSTDELIAMAKKWAKEDQVFLTVLGFGQGNVQDNRMEQLANKVDGFYHYIDTEREGRKVLVDEMSATLVPIAKDVKIQVEFNPAKVKSYRLIGYANRLLANRDFTDDKKDAGDMGAGHTVTAFYEVVPTGYQSLGPNAAPLKYRSGKIVEEPEPVGVSEDLVTVRLRYKKPKEETSQEFETSLVDAGKGWNQASEDFRFAASVAAFGMILRSSPYCQASLATVRDWAKGAKSGDEYGWRAECVQLIEKAMQL